MVPIKDNASPNQQTKYLKGNQNKIAFFLYEIRIIYVPSDSNLLVTILLKNFVLNIFVWYENMLIY